MENTSKKQFTEWKKIELLIKIWMIGLVMKMIMRNLPIEGIDSMLKIINKEINIVKLAIKYLFKL